MVNTEEKEAFIKAKNAMLEAYSSVQNSAYLNIIDYINQLSMRKIPNFIIQKSIVIVEKKPADFSILHDKMDKILDKMEKTSKTIQEKREFQESFAESRCSTVAPPTSLI